MRGNRLAKRQYSEMLRLATLYHKEAERCRRAKAYVASCVMIGAALEASLTAFCDCYYEEIPPTAIPKGKTKSKPILKWTLAELLRVAKRCNWLPAGLEYGKDAWDHRRARVADYAEVVREVRNLVHPGRYVVDFTDHRLTAHRAELCFDILYAVNDHLLAKLYESIRRALPEKKRRNRETT